MKNTPLLLSDPKELSKRYKSESFISFGERNKKTQENEFGWKEATSLSKDEACLFFLNGDAASTPPSANGISKCLYEIFSDDKDSVVENGVGFHLYSSYYNFTETYDSYKARTIFSCQKKQANIKDSFVETREEALPKYAEDLYKIILKDRVSQEGKKLPVKEACRNVRKVTFLLYCHGTYAFLKMEEILENNLKELGYSTKERELIEKNLFAVSCASPVVPQGITKTSLVSIFSLADRFVEENNGSRLKQNLIQLNREKKYKNGVALNLLDISENEKLITISNMIKGESYPYGRHDLWPYIRRGALGRTLEAQDLSLFVRRVLRSAMMNSLAQNERYTPLPSLNKLYFQDEKHPLWTEEEEAYDRFLIGMKKDGDKLKEEMMVFSPSPLEGRVDSTLNASKLRYAR